jgi:parvulin-like peptidyl-prolyl isomerase
VWSEPIRSAYGWHRVRIESRQPGGTAPLAEVRSQVIEVYSVKRREDAIAKFVTKSLKSYRVMIDGKPLQNFAPGKRLAFRSQASGED